MLFIMKIRKYIPDHAVTTIPVLALMFAVHYFLLRDEPVDAGIESSNSLPAYYEHWLWNHGKSDFDVDAELERLKLDDAAHDQLIRDLLRQGKYQQARTQLLEVAAAAVAEDDQARLGETMLLLGDVAIHQQELSAAEIYLQEGLYLAMLRDDVMGTARSYQLLGQLNIRARELARRASNTHDELWQARNLTSRGLYHGVGERLQWVIAENMEIRRFGAAADAWEALAALQDKLHDGYQAQLARIEAARLYASTGQTTRVRRLLDGLDRKLISESGLADVEREMDELFKLHQQDQVQTSQARDYQMLYHHYQRIGQVDRAWKFRIKASEKLASTTNRSVFQRQADIVAVLYSSNFARDRARQYLDRAGTIYSDEGVTESLEETRNMENLIY